MSFLSLLLLYQTSKKVVFHDAPGCGGFDLVTPRSPTTPRSAAPSSNWKDFRSWTMQLDLGKTSCPPMWHLHQHPIRRKKMFPWLSNWEVATIWLSNCNTQVAEDKGLPFLMLNLGFGSPLQLQRTSRRIWGATVGKRKVYPHNWLEEQVECCRKRITTVETGLSSKHPRYNFHYVLTGLGFIINL